MRYGLIVLLGLLLSGTALHAQPQCGIAESISYPVDTTVFALVQDFGAPSPRHQGRYHTGEDWYAGRVAGYGYGMPVVAAATGRVTYSAPTGWGRDGGVVIIEHTFPDGTLAYTQYGHMVELDTARFPPQWGCVQAGEIIGAVGDARPAPHLHFEVRASNGTSPGPGYSWDDPVTQGWRQPAKFIQNWQTWFTEAYRWRLDLADESGPVTPPLALDDFSLLYLDAGRLGRVTPDGRSMWRINTPRPAVGLAWLNNQPTLIYADGGMQVVNRDGTLSTSWETGLRFSGAPLPVDAALLLPTDAGGLVALDAGGQAELWRLDAVGPVTRSHAAPQALGLVAAGGDLLTLARSGQLLDRAHTRAGAALTTAPDGTLTAYTQGGLWSILADGEWQMALPTAPAAGISAAVTYTADGLYLFDGDTLHAYDRLDNPRWQVRLPDVVGEVRLTDYAPVLLLTSNHGDLIAVRASDGAICGRTRIYGHDGAQMWHTRSADGLLRVAVSDQLLGLDWATFTNGCS